MVVTNKQEGEIIGTHVKLADVPKEQGPYAGIEGLPFEGFTVPEYDEGETNLFDEDKHLGIKLPETVAAHGVYPDRSKSPSGLAYAGPFPVLSHEGVKAVRKDLDKWNAMKDDDSHSGGDNLRIAHCLRRLSARSRYIYDFCNNQKLADHLSTLAGEKVQAQNIQGNQFQANYGYPGNKRKIDQWHCDSVGYVLVVVITDLGPDPVGGELQCIVKPLDTATKLIKETEGEIDNDLLLTVPNTNLGYGVLLQGSEIAHHVSALEKAEGVRISIVLPFQASNPFAKEQTVVSVIKDFDGFLGYEEYAKHRAWRAASQLNAYVKGDVKLDDAEKMTEFFGNVESEINYTKKVLNGTKTDYPWQTPISTVATLHDQKDCDNKRVLVIGAGPSGLSILRAFALAKKNGESVPNLTCYERQNDWGGQWNYTFRVNKDINGEPVHSSMYQNLWSNGPKEVLEFADYSFEEHFGKNIGSYPSRAVLADYVIGRAKKSNIRDMIQFETVVRNVQKNSAGMFEVLSFCYKTKKEKTEVFDNVVVATGHFTTPNYPEFEGIETFPGRVLHAHDFRSAREFAGKRLLLIGSSYSAEDIGLQCKKFGAESVTFSYRTSPMGFKFPLGMKELPLLQSIKNDQVTFQDGTVESFDVIMMCTGYIHDFPFLPSENLRLETYNRLYSPGLYKGVVWDKDPDMFYIGMQDQWYTFTMFDAEAWFVRDAIQGKKKIPSQKDRNDDMVKWSKKEALCKTALDMIDFQADYLEDLLQDTDYPKFDIALTKQEFRKWKQGKADSIVNYRNLTHKSPVTGKESVKHHTEWWDAVDDSLETYLQRV